MSQCLNYELNHKFNQESSLQSDIKNSIGGTYYNLLQRLVKDGHYFEKSANGMMKIIHKDDGDKKAAKAKR